MSEGGELGGGAVQEGGTVPLGGEGAGFRGGLFPCCRRPTAMLYENGVDTVAKFAAAASDEADLKKMLKDSFSIDPTESLKLRA